MASTGSSWRVTLCNCAETSARLEAGYQASTATSLTALTNSTAEDVRNFGYHLRAEDHDHHWHICDNETTRYSVIVANLVKRDEERKTQEKEVKSWNVNVSKTMEQGKANHAQRPESERDNMKELIKRIKAIQQPLDANEDRDTKKRKQDFLDGKEALKCRIAVTGTEHPTLRMGNGGKLGEGEWPPDGMEPRIGHLSRCR